MFARCTSVDSARRLPTVPREQSDNAISDFSRNVQGERLQNVPLRYWIMRLFSKRLTIVSILRFIMLSLGVAYKPIIPHGEHMVAVRYMIHAHAAVYDFNQLTV